MLNLRIQFILNGSSDRCRGNVGSGKWLELDSSEMRVQIPTMRLHPKDPHSTLMRREVDGLLVFCTPELKPVTILAEDRGGNIIKT